MKTEAAFKDEYPLILQLLYGLTLNQNEINTLLIENSLAKNNIPNNFIEMFIDESDWNGAEIKKAFECKII